MRFIAKKGLLLGYIVALSGCGKQYDYTYNVWQPTQEITENDKFLSEEVTSKNATSNKETLKK